MAERRFRNVKRKFAKLSALHEQYVAIMREYTTLGHMTKITSNSQLIIKTASKATKVVFNGSAKSSNRVFLNNVQQVTSIIQDDFLFLSAFAYITSF